MSPEYVAEGVYIDELSGVMICGACECAIENGSCLCDMRDW